VDVKITLIAASNDWGTDNTVPWGTVNGDFWTEYLPDSYLMPQYSPYVTAVGGTILTMRSMSYGSEKGWERSGGGPSNLFPEPKWQTGKGVPQNGFRNIPDIALDASCDTPYSLYGKGGGWTFCGTSGAAPTFAGIVADIEQAAGGRLGFLNPTLYSLASSDPTVYHGITSGCSLWKPKPNEQVTKTGYCAHAGWNFVTGWGSIDAAKLAKHLAPNAQIVTTTSTSVSTSSLMSTSSVTAGANTSELSLSTLALQTPLLGWSNTLILGATVGIIIVLAAIVALRKHGTKRYTSRSSRARETEPNGDP
jgi:subtilase family serine protease